MNKINKTIMLVFMILVLAFSVSAQDYTTVEGESVQLTAAANVGYVQEWEIIGGDLHGYDGNPFSNMEGNTVDFTMPLEGNFTVKAFGSTSSATMHVEVLDVLAERGFGHQCYVVDTSNCGDLISYGSVLASQNIAATDIYSYGRVHSFGTITIGSFLSPAVELSETLVSLPDTKISGNLNFSGILSAYTPAGLISILDDTEMMQDLDVQGSAYLYRVEYISNAGNDITVDADVDVSGDLDVGNILTVNRDAAVTGNMVVAGDAIAGQLDVLGDVDVQGNVYVEQPTKRILGSINLDKNCGDSGPRIYQQGEDTIIDLGTC